MSEMSPANSGTNTNNGARDGDGHSTDVSAYPRHSPQIGRTPRNVAAAAPHRYRPGPGPRMCPVSRLGPVAGDLWDELSAGQRDGNDGQ